MALRFHINTQNYVSIHTYAHSCHVPQIGIKQTREKNQANERGKGQEKEGCEYEGRYAQNIMNVSHNTYAKA